MAISLNDLTQQVIKIAIQAGELITENKDIEIHSKDGHANYVTNMDIACQEFLIEQLTSLLDAGFMVEEDDVEHLWLKDYTWIIDPIDGTTNYTRNFQHSCISIALAYKKEVVLGVVYNPYLKEIFHAIKGQGSYCNDIKIHVSEQPVESALIIFGTALYDLANADITFETAKNLFLQCADVRRTGSAALDLCYVACGRCDGFFEYRLSPWDYAAASLIVRESNGHIEGIHHAFTLEQPIGIIAGNAKVFPLIKKTIVR